MDLNRLKELAGIDQPQLNETAPPGKEHVVKALKAQYPGDEEKAYKIAWAQYNKEQGKGVREEIGDELAQQDDVNSWYIVDTMGKVMSPSFESKQEANHYAKTVRWYDSNKHTIEYGTEDIDGSFVETQVGTPEYPDDDYDIVHDVSSEVDNEEDEVIENFSLGHTDESEELEETQEDEVGNAQIHQVQQGSDYFPNGADGPIQKARGIAGAKMGDNALREAIQLETKKIHKELIGSYRKFLNENSGQ